MEARVVLLLACLAPILVGGVWGQASDQSVATETPTNTPQIPMETHLIPEGDSGKIQCPTKGHTVQESNLDFAWTYHGLPHIEHGYFDEISGSLYINEANAMASGRYDCWWSGSGGTSGSYSHRLIVYKLPQVHFQISSLFTVQKCVTSVDTEVAERYKNRLCSGSDPADCPYEVSHQCSDKNGQAQLVVSVTIKLPKDYRPPVCETDCIRKNMAVVLNSLKESLKPKWKEVFLGDPKAFQYYNSAPGKASEQILESCKAGFLPFNASVCAPCEPGTAWDEGSRSCVTCPKNTYQDRAAALECKRCPAGKQTNAGGVTSITKCYVPAAKVSEVPKKDVRDNHHKSKNVDAKDMILASSIGIGLILLFVVCALLVLVCLIKKNEKRQHNMFMHKHLDEADKFERLFGNRNKFSSDRITEDGMDYPSTSADAGKRP